jgi:hypothetical protein
MKKLKEYSWIGIAGLFIATLLASGCAGGSSLKNLSPVQPAEALPAEIVRDTTHSDMFEYTALEPILSMTQEKVTIAITYWRRADLDRKFNRGNTASPFYESEALHQGDKVDVFYVKITNSTDRPILFDVRKCMMIDQGKNLYGGQDYEALKNRLLYMSRVGGLYVKNGLDKAKEILIEKKIGRPEDGIPPKKSEDSDFPYIEGFLPFAQLKPNATGLEVIIPIEIAPPEGTAARYKKIEFKFPFTHDRGIRTAQPPPIRY